VEEAAAAIMAQAMAAAEEEGKRAGCDTAVLAAKTTVKRTLLPLITKLKEMAENGQAEEAAKLIQLLQEAVASPTAPHRTIRNKCSKPRC